MSVTDWGQSIPSVTRGLDSVLVDLGWRVNSVTNADRAIMDSPSVAVNVCHHKKRIKYSHYSAVIKSLTVLVYL